MNQTCSICGQLRCQEHLSVQVSAQPEARAASGPCHASAQVVLGQGGETASEGGEDPAPIGPGQPQAGLAGPRIIMSGPKPGNVGREAAGGRHGQACCPGDEEAGDGHGADVQGREGTRTACCAACDSAPIASHTVAGAEEASSGEGPSIRRLGLASVLALGSEIANFASLHPVAVIGLAVLAVAVGGLSTWLAGWKSIRRLRLDILALMSVAVTGAVLIGDFSEAALVLVLFSLAEALEGRSVDRARKAIAALLQLAPEKATILAGDGSWVEAKASEVQAGTVVRVRPGEKLALDGVVVSGASAIDQSPITGESAPAEKAKGDKVFAGTMNVTGTLDYEVSVAYGDSALSRIVRTVEEAEGSRAPVERFVERFARVYTPAVFALAVLAGILPPLLAGGAWGDWIYRALALLVIACPCALVVSTPVAILSALATATKGGLLVKGGVYLEEGRRLRVVAMDKTGTLTSGKPSRTDFLPLGGYDPREADLLSASLAALSRHPVSQAIVAASAERGRLVALDDFADLPGLGVSATFRGRRLALGSPGLMASLGLMAPGLRALADGLEAQGKSVVALADGDSVAAVFATADTIKEESRQAVAELKALGVETVMLTGDNAPAAEAVARAVGLDGYRSSLMPDEKLALIEEFSRKGKVGMVGDGINDAPALARADIGFSMGAAGTGTAIETADVAIMDDNLAKIPAFIRLSRMVHAVFSQNIAFILLVKLAFIAVTLMGHTAMWMAVFADIGVCLIVMANSLRLTRRGRP